MRIDGVTHDDVARAKRAIVVLSEMAKVACAAACIEEPIETKQDRLALIKIVRKVEAVLPKPRADAAGDWHIHPID